MLRKGIPRDETGCDLFHDGAWGSGSPPARSILGVVTNSHVSAGEDRGTPKLEEAEKSLAGLY